MLTVNYNRILFTQGEMTLAVLLQPVKVSWVENTLSLSTSTSTVILDLTLHTFECGVKGTLDEYEVNQIKKLLKRDPELKGKPRSIELRNKQGFPVCWIKSNLENLPEVTSIRNTKFNNKQLKLVIFKLGLHCTVPQLRRLIDESHSSR